MEVVGLWLCSAIMHFQGIHEKSMGKKVRYAAKSCCSACMYVEGKIHLDAHLSRSWAVSAQDSQYGQKRAHSPAPLDSVDSLYNLGERRKNISRIGEAGTRQCIWK